MKMLIYLNSNPRISIKVLEAMSNLIDSRWQSCDEYHTTCCCQQIYIFICMLHFQVLKYDSGVYTVRATRDGQPLKLAVGELLLIILINIV